MSEQRRRLVVVAVVAVTVVVAGAAFAAAQFASPTTAGVGLAASVSSSTAGSTSTTGTTHATTTSTVVRQLSPAWVEGQPFLDPDTVLAPGGLRRAVDRYRENPNQWSTPMEEERHGLISACLSRALALSVVSEAMSSRRSEGP